MRFAAIAFPVILAAASMALTASPISNGNITSDRTAWAPCPGTTNNSSAAADCTVELGANPLLPADQLFGIIETRMGDRGPSGDWELGLWPAGSSTPSEQRQYVLPNGTAVDFELSFDPSTGTLTYEFGNQTLTDSYSYANGREVSNLFIRTFAGLMDSSVSVFNLVLTQGAVTSFPGESSTATFGGVTAGAGMVQYLHISNIDPTQAWTLNGQAKFTWNGQNAPRGSNLAFQIKLGDSPTEPNTEVPEPSTWMMLLSGAGLLTLARMRRARAAKS